MLVSFHRPRSTTLVIKTVLFAVLPIPPVTGICTSQTLLELTEGCRRFCCLESNGAEYTRRDAHTRLSSRS